MLCGDVGDVEAANVTVALDKGKDRLLGFYSAGGAVLLFATDEGFIGFNDLVACNVL